MKKGDFIKKHGKYPHRPFGPYSVMVENSRGELIVENINLDGAVVGEDPTDMISVATYREWLKDLDEKALRKLKHPDYPDQTELVQTELKRRHLAVSAKNMRSAKRYVQQNVVKASELNQAAKAAHR
jgi:hypothetical protein